MVLHFDTPQQRLVRADAFRRRLYVNRVRRQHEAWQAGRVTLDALCAEAGAALRDYASEALEALMSAIEEADEPEPAEWALEAYHQGISDAGVAIREVIAEPSARHAVAQRLQEQLLLAETHLRQTIEAARARRRHS